MITVSAFWSLATCRWLLAAGQNHIARSQSPVTRGLIPFDLRRFNVEPVKQEKKRSLPYF
jgi:hypothetical protein